jgi:hypothetical protein
MSAATKKQKKHRKHQKYSWFCAFLVRLNFVSAKRNVNERQNLWIDCRSLESVTSVGNVALQIIHLIMTKKKKVSEKKTKDSSTSGALLPAVPPPDDPLHRAQEFDPDREYKSREMAQKRLEAIKKTQQMPKSSEESPPSEPEQKTSDT